MTDTQWEAVVRASEAIRTAVDRRRAEDVTSHVLLVVLFGLGTAALVAGVVAGFLGNQLLTGILIGGAALANALLLLPVRELRRKRNLSLVLETVPALLALGPADPHLQAKLVDLVDKLIALVERGE